MKVKLTNIMGVDLEKTLTIDMHKNLGKISEKSNPTIFKRLDEMLFNNNKLSYDVVHCWGYVDNNDKLEKISLCKGIIKKISSLHLDYESLIVGQHVESYAKLKATRCSMKMYYNSINCEFYEKICGKEGKIYEINKKSECKLSYHNNILTIDVLSLKEPSDYSKLIELIHYMYEVIFLTEGFFPKRIAMSVDFTNIEGSSNIYYRFEKSYQGHKSQNTEIGAQVFKRETILKEWILFRKKTDSLFDYYLYSTNNLQFLDVDLFHLITVLEGYSKYTEVINDKSHKKKHGKSYVKLYDRLKELAESSTESKIVFSTQIENNEDYVLKLVDHRNDFSHQFQYKKPFEEEEMAEFFHKINLFLRILFFREVGVDVQDRQIRAIVRKYFNSKKFVPTYDRVLSATGDVIILNENDEDKQYE